MIFLSCLNHPFRNRYRETLINKDRNVNKNLSNISLLFYIISCSTSFSNFFGYFFLLKKKKQ
ncbi:hypothetical protein B0W20_07075 [Bacillus spizizenii]|nr:hypothetical protein BAX60_13080 [Bacillus subtilis]MBE0171809.1 hypothetical protein [Bacillus spizizenii]MDR4201324.1 hypothetical protein [Bacillus spizizenii ATCC 6633 = JCM 2499]MBK4202671.1 hypothetical protein [Bacillus subtilis]OPG90341.1 hypothetical protein B2I22_17555 [Bacillus spizizenii]